MCNVCLQDLREELGNVLVEAGVLSYERLVTLTTDELGSIEAALNAAYEKGLIAGTSQGAQAAFDLAGIDSDAPFEPGLDEIFDEVFVISDDARERILAGIFANDVEAPSYGD